MSRTVFIVRFFSRNGWETFEEYGSSMRDVAIQKANELSIPFGDAEVRVVQMDVSMDSWKDGILLEHLQIEKSVLQYHMERYPDND